MTALCGFGGYCVRMPGHKGAHTACPSACTLDWDEHYAEREEKHIADAVTLWMLDFPTPSDAHDDL